MTARRKERIDELDVLRGMAILSVILQHALGVYIRRPEMQFADAAMIGMLFNITKFAVPAFVFVTGAALVYNYYDNLDYPKFLWKRVKDILLPYLIWSIAYEIYSNGLPATNYLWLRGLAKDLLYGNAFYHLWFVVMIFQFYLVYPVFRSLFRKAPAILDSKLRFAAAVGLLAAIYTFIMWFSSSYIPSADLHAGSKAVQVIFIELRDRNFIYFFFYFILGGIAGLILPRWREFVARSCIWNTYVLASLFIWIGFELMQGVSGGLVNLNYSTSLKPSMFFYTVSEIIFLYGVSMVIANSGSIIFKFFSLAGKYSYGIYLVHAFLLIYAVGMVDRFSLTSHHLLAGVYSFILCALGTIAVVMLISKIPGGKFLIGPIPGK
ncbi:Acyltransferase family protein [Pelotomaculum sp. FP]|uniref:acyltransferase n=1 Tax=Pelotomaculum sp. FP TaxID=261474 RepID=UPI001064BF62|nr:acyltransferase [Pelotomaculum sp. FP]TEB15876.1 Acyltransferase family protein [Pelotomaculum sp. FP]